MRLFLQHIIYYQQFQDSLTTKKSKPQKKKLKKKSTKCVKFSLLKMNNFVKGSASYGVTENAADFQPINTNAMLGMFLESRISDVQSKIQIKKPRSKKNRKMTKKRHDMNQ